MFKLSFLNHLQKLIMASAGPTPGVRRPSLVCGLVKPVTDMAPLKDGVAKRKATEELDSPADRKRVKHDETPVLEKDASQGAHVVPFPEKVRQVPAMMMAAHKSVACSHRGAQWRD